MSVHKEDITTLEKLRLSQEKIMAYVSDYGLVATDEVKDKIRPIIKNALYFGYGEVIEKVPGLFRYEIRFDEGSWGCTVTITYFIDWSTRIDYFHICSLLS